MSHKIVYDKWTFPADKIRDGNLYLATSLLASALEVNTLSATVECADPSILDFQRNAQLLYYARSDRPMVFRVQSILRVAPTLYALSCTSTLGLLTEGQHMGGIYTGQTAADLIASICGDVPYIVKSNLAGVKLYGWLPIAPPRDNLAQVLFALGATLKTDLDGILRIEGLWDGISGQVSKDNMYIDAAVDYSSKVTQVIVTEHQYLPWEEQKQLFEGTAQQRDIITFDEPMHSLTAEGFTILDSGANWAQVSAGTGTLTGKTYIHNTRLIARDVQTANTPNVKTVDKATLVSLVNSSAVADRLAAFYKCTETINAPIIYHGEDPGNVMRDYHPFDKAAVNACLQSADITLSGTLKAQEKSLVGFEPPQDLDTQIIEKAEIITKDTIWEAEFDTTVSAVLIGGGQGGGAGQPGESATTKSATSSQSSVTNVITYDKSTYYGVAGKGGVGGIGGSGGKIYQITFDVRKGEKIQAKIGAGGKGGIYGENFGNGGLGGNTTFGVYTSASGSAADSGFIEIISQKKYGAKGETGKSGGRGAGLVAEGGDYSDGETIQGGYTPGASSKTVISDEAGELRYNISAGSKVYAYGEYGYGGGPAFGANGKDGKSDASASTRYNYADKIASATAQGGDGGDGADALPPQKATTPGMGGPGGNGGGGGGIGGRATAQNKYGNASDNPYPKATLSATSGRGGNGGAPSAGGDGAPGCVILYYGVPSKPQQSGQFVDKYGRLILDKISRKFVV